MHGQRGSVPPARDLMLSPGYSHQFKKDLRRFQASGSKTIPLKAVMQQLINELPLSPIHDDHPLKGEWNRHRSCRPQGDLVLIYHIRGSEITFERLGSHSEIYGA
jgi:mRNA interferase YafQ